MGRPGERGLALVSVLWGIAILSLIAAAMLMSSNTSTHMERNAWNTARAGAIAEANISRAILSLLDKRAKERWRVDGTPRDVLFEGVKSRIWIQDESGRIDLNSADATLLQGLFQSAGADPNSAGAIVAAIVARRTQTPATKELAFHSVEEVKVIPGAEPLFSRVAPALTVFSHAPSIDANLAPREALLAMPGMDAQKIADIFDARDKADDEARENLDATAPLHDGHTFTIIVETALNGALMIRSAVVLITGDPAQPFLFLDWR